MAKLRHLRSSVAGRRPTNTALETGQIFINLADKSVSILDSSGQVVDVAYANTARLIGDWNASTNTPALPPATPTNSGNYYRVSADGATEVDGITSWKTDDLALSLGSKYIKIGSSDAVVLTGSDSIDITGTAISVKIDPTAGNQLVSTLSGLRVNAGTTAVVTEDSATVAFTGDGSGASPISADIQVSADAGNTLSEKADGLFVPTSLQTVAVTNTAGTTISGDGTAASPLAVSPVVDPASTNALKLSGVGLLVPRTIVNSISADANGNITLDPTNIGAHGVAALDVNGKVSIAVIPESLIGAVTYVSAWAASTNTPTLPDPTTVKGHYYVASDAGVMPGTSDPVGQGDWVISNGVIWEKLDALDAVQSVAGKTGVIILEAADIASGVFNAARLGSSVANSSILTINGSGVSTWVPFADVVGVTSVGLSVPAALLSVTNSPVTSTGTMAVALVDASANQVFAGPASGAAGSPAYRLLEDADIPTLDEGEYIP